MIKLNKQTTEKYWKHLLGRSLGFFFAEAFIWVSHGRKPKNWRFIEQAYVVLYFRSKDVLKAIHTLEDFNFHCLLSFIYIKLFDNRAEAEHPCIISSIEPLSHNRSRATLTEASNPENVHPSFVFQGNHKGILHPRCLNVVLDWAPILFIVHRKSSLLQSSQHWMHFTRAHFTGPRTNYQSRSLLESNPLRKPQPPELFNKHHPLSS